MGGGGGKGGTSTSTVSIPPEVLARYNAVNARAEEVAKKPFEAYTGEFVSPINEEQTQGISQTQKYSEAAQPYYARAAGMTEDAYNASQPLTSEQIQQYQNPYIQSVVDPTLKALQQQQGIDRQTQAAQAIRSGAFGGERAGLQRAVLGGQQELAQAISPLYASAYQNALATAQQQQGQRVAAGMQAGQQTAGIGTGAQQAGLQGGQAVIGAGTLKQQTGQALDTAKYQQFLQERGYDFQTAQFLANIAEGTGALSGSTTTTTQPTSFFSDERLKHDIKKIGKTNDGQPIYSFKYNGDDRTQIGLLAQEVEKKHPEAVGLSGGYKTVDYAKATAGSRTARAFGGLVPESMGGAVFEPGNFARGGYVGGGLVNDPNDIQAILAQQKQSFGPFAQGGLYGGSAQQDPHGAAPGYVPKASLAVPKLVTSSFQPKQQQGGLQSAMQDINAASTTASTLSKGYDWAQKKLEDKPAATTTSGTGSNPPLPTVRPSSEVTGTKISFGTDEALLPQEVTNDIWTGARGGIVPREHYDSGGMIDPYKEPSSGSMVPEDVMQDSEDTKNKAEGQAIKPDGSRGGGSGGGGGLGSALGAASSLMTVGKGIGSFASWLPTLFTLKDGGAVYGHYADGGVVPRQGYQTAGRVPDTQQGYAITVPDELIPHFTAASEATGVPVPVLAAQAKQESRFRPDATGAAGEVGIGQILPSTARNPGYGMQGVDPAELRDPAKNIMFQAQYMKGIGDKFGVKDWSDPEQTAKALRAYNGGGDPNYVQNVFGHLYGSSAPKVGEAPQQQSYPLQQQIEGGLGKAKSVADSLAPRTYQGQDRSMGEFLTSRDFVIPLLTGLGTMASSPSRYLGAAILQGLGGGAQAFANLQKQQADIDRTRADTTSTLSNISPQNLVGQYDSKGNLTWNVRKPTAPGQLGLAGGTQSGTGSLPEATGTAAAPKAPELSPLSINTDQGRYNWEVKPTQMTDQYFAKNGLGSDPYTIRAMLLQKGLSAEADDKIAAATKAAATNSTEARMKIGQLTDELNRLATSPSKSTGVGPAQPERAAAANLYNYLAGLAGLPGLQLGGADKDVTSSQIINKIQQDFGSSQAQNRGFHAGYIADQLTSAFPTGSMTPEAARKMSAALYVGNQMAADFSRYHDNYVQKYGTSYGAAENFRREMGSHYDTSKKSIEKVLSLPGVIENLRAHPERAAEFDKRTGTPGLARMFVGG